MERNISTLFYSLNGFESSESGLYDVESLFDESSKEYGDVYRLLKMTEVEPSKSSMANILDYSKSVSNNNPAMRNSFA